MLSILTAKFLLLKGSDVMDILLDVVFEGIDFFAGIIFDLVETKIERAKCIKKASKKKKRS